MKTSKTATIIAESVKVIDIDGGRNKLIQLTFSEEQRDDIIIAIVKALKKEDINAQARKNRRNAKLRVQTI
jgi:hypothetical protein